MQHRVSVSQWMTAVEVQLQVIYALIMREMLSRFGRTNFGYLWAFLSPLLFIGMLTLMRTFLARSGTFTPDMIPFLIAGVLPFISFRQTMKLTMTATRSNRRLLMHPRVTSLDVMLARLCLQIPTSLVTFGFVFLVLYWFGITDTMERPLGVVAAFFLSALLGFGVGAVFAVIVNLFPVMETVLTLMMRPMFLASGLFYTAGELPEPLRTWLLWNPCLHISELCRSAYFWTFESEYYDTFYVIRWIAFTMVFGLLFERTVRPRVSPG